MRKTEEKNNDKSIIKNLMKVFGGSKAIVGKIFQTLFDQNYSLFGVESLLKLKKSLNQIWN